MRSVVDMVMGKTASRDACAGSRTRIDCLEGSHANRYTTHARNPPRPPSGTTHPPPVVDDTAGDEDKEAGGRVDESKGGESRAGGSVVECSPATRAARVRFPAGATPSPPLPTSRSAIGVFLCPAQPPPLALALALGHLHLSPHPHCNPLYCNPLHFTPIVSTTPNRITTTPTRRLLRQAILFHVMQTNHLPTSPDPPQASIGSLLGQMATCIIDARRHPVTNWLPAPLAHLHLISPASVQHDLSCI